VKHPSEGAPRPRLPIAALSALGLADALYMLAYEEGLIDSLVCPFFGEGCNVVGRSRYARHFGVPNAAVGAAAYGILGTLALWPGRPAGLPAPVRALTTRLIAGAAVAASALLIWEQAAKVRAWCFWCLSSAAINAGILLLALRDWSDADTPRDRCPRC
jgi:uncharacterized membrane protein